MEFRIREPGNGVVEIVQFEPVVVGSFSDRDMAEKFMAFLMEDAIAAAVPEPRKPASSIKPARATEAPISNVKPLEPEQPAKREPSKPSVPKLVTVEGAAAAQSDEEWAEAELNAAFARLARGEKLRDVADAFGKSWTKLRGKWAVLKSSYDPDPAQPEPEVEAQLPALPRDFKTPIQKVTTAITELKDQNACNLCGRHFNITPDNIDTCQRCQNGA